MTNAVPDKENKMRNPIAALGIALLSFLLSATGAPSLEARETIDTHRFTVETMVSGPDVIMIPGLNSTRDRIVLSPATSRARPPICER